ncbi:MAG: hypothetical protein WC554_16045 [Clostridia bacterium]|jgi:hypothetical protein
MKSKTLKAEMQQYIAGNSGNTYCYYWPMRRATATMRRLGYRIRRGWIVAGIIASGTMAEAGKVLVVNRNGYWYAI